MSDDRKLIFLIGGTGAQGVPVVKHLLRPNADGKVLFKIRALTRDPASKRSQKLADMGVELLHGWFTDFDIITQGMTGAYGAFINTDGFSVGAQGELHAGIRIYEIARETKVKHFIWSNLDYITKVSGWDRTYAFDHYDGTGRVGEYLKAQESNFDDPNGMAWTILTTSPYMEMTLMFFGPYNIREDGTRVFAQPIGNGHVPMSAVEDIGWWTRYIFDDPHRSQGKDFEIASELVSWPHLVETFTKVTGLKAVFVPLTFEKYWTLWKNTNDELLASTFKGPKFKDSFTGFWSTWRDDVIKRDWAWLESVHPNHQTLEGWMRERNYKGEWEDFLRTDGMWRPDYEQMKLL